MGTAAPFLIKGMLENCRVSTQTCNIYLNIALIAITVKDKCRRHKSTAIEQKVIQV